MASITILSEESRQNAAPDPKKDERLLPKLIEKFAAEDPDFIIGMNAVLPETPNAPLQYDELTVSRLDNAINYMAYWIEQSIQKLHLSSNEPIGYSGLQDLRYLVLEIAAIKIGRPILLPSPRNAVVNTISLLRETGCRVVFYSGDLGVQESELKNSIPELTMLEVPLLSQMTNSETPHYPYTKTWEQAKDDVVMIIHTSGSTGVPKPICHNNSVIRRLDIESEIPTIPGRVNASTSLCEPGKAVLCGTNLYHLSGICFTLMALFNRYTIVFGPADGLPSGEVMYEMIKSMKFAGLVMVPSLLDHLISKHGEEIEGFLGELEHVNWLGGPLSPSTGSWIIHHLPTVTLWQIYGSTEMHMFPLLIPPKSHWSYLEFHPSFTPDLDLVDADEGLYEVVVRRPATITTPVFDIFPHLDEWRSRDILRRCTDPGFENLYRYEGRTDDVLVLSNGLKVNPLHIEVVVQSCAFVAGCLVFGEGRTRCGILIEGREGEEELSESVWRVVEGANRGVPEHARIARELVVVGVESKRFVRSSKGAPIRRLTLELYGEEIERVYEGLS